MLKLLVLAGLVAGAFFAWKKLTATPEDDEFGDDLYGAPTGYEHADTQGAAPA